MDSGESQYQNALKNLSGSHFSRGAIMGEDENSVATMGKTITSDFGNMLIGHVATSSIGSLAKGGNALKSLGIGSDDAKILAAALSKGDARGVARMVSKIGSDKVRNGIEKLTGKKLTDDELPKNIQDSAQKIANDTGNPQQTEPDLGRRPPPRRTLRPNQGQETDEYEDESSSYQHTSDDSDYREPSTEDDNYYSRTDQSDLEPQASEEGGEVTGDVLTDVSKTADVTSDLTKTVAAGSDISEAFGDAAALSTAADESGVGLLVTAGLGIASLMAGLFIKNKKPKVIAPPVFSNNAAVQAGEN